jgi:hypothetical protein
MSRERERAIEKKVVVRKVDLCHNHLQSLLSCATDPLLLRPVIGGYWQRGPERRVHEASASYQRSRTRRASSQYNDWRIKRRAVGQNHLSAFCKASGLNVVSEKRRHGWLDGLADAASAGSSSSARRTCSATPPKFLPASLLARHRGKLS